MTSKGPTRYEAFVEDPKAFQKGQALRLNHHPGWLHEIREPSVLVSCQTELEDLENVQVCQKYPCH